MSLNSLFDKEQAVIDHVSTLLKDDGITPEVAREHLSYLLEQYKKLLRQTQQLVKLNDSHANKLHQLNDHLKQYSESLEYSASHDALTGLFNKGAITDMIRKQLDISEFILIIFDIDHFKKVNDSFGHHIGDQVLSKVAQLVKNSLNQNGYIGRFGGEEFIIIYNDITVSNCLDKASQILRKIEQAELVNIGATSVSVTVSMGLTLVNKGEIFEKIYDRVDKLLYAAKQNGRNRLETDVTEWVGFNLNTV